MFSRTSLLTSYMTCACSQNLRSVVPPYKKWFKPGLKPFGEITGCPNWKPNGLPFHRNFQTETELSGFGSVQTGFALV